MSASVTPYPFRAIRMALCAASLLLMMTGMAFAHPGHEGAPSIGFIAGLAHPLLGVDHLLAMAAIGLWSVRQSTPMRRVAPWLAAAGMLLGAGLAWWGVAMPGVEAGIALSVLLVGVLIAALIKLPTVLGGALVVLFMLFHGHAHGNEMPHDASLMAYLAGFLLATLAITYAGRTLGGHLMGRENRIVRVVGAAIASVGGFFALT